MIYNKDRIPGRQHLFSYVRIINGEERIFYGFEKWISCKYERVTINGKYKKKVVAKRRVERSKFTCLEDAEKALLLLMKQLALNPASVINPNIKLSELIEKWLENLKGKQLSTEHLMRAEIVAEEFKTIAGDIRIDDIGESHLSDYAEFLRKNKEYNDSTINIYITILRGCFNSARKFYPDLMWNPPRFEKVVIEKVEPEVTDGMIYKIIKALKELNNPRSPDVADMVLIASKMNLKKVEVISLEWSSVKFTEEAEYPHGHLVLITKTGQEKRIPMSRTVRDVLFERFKKKSESEEVFNWNIPLRSKMTRVEEEFMYGCSRAGIPVSRDKKGGMRFQFVSQLREDQTI